MASQHKYIKTIRHNMKGYDGYFLSEYLIDQSMTGQDYLQRIKIIHMMVEKDLHIKIVDSLNVLPMKVSKLPETFGLKELKKGWFPHFYNKGQPTICRTLPNP